jgi:GTP-binding protein
MAEIVEASREAAPAAEAERIVLRPRAVDGGDDDFTVVATDEGWRVRGTKPERWVRQTDFSNEEAVGFLADRLNRLGVELKLAQMGAQEGDAVLIGPEDNSVVFDFKPSIEAGAEMLGRRGEDERFREDRPARDRRRDIAEAMETKAEEEARADVARRLDEERKKKGPNRSTGSSGVGPMAYEIGSKDDPDWDGSDD